MRGSRVWFAVGAAILAAVAAWGFAPVFRALTAKWSSDPQYSHGYLVPALAGVILYVRRDRLRGAAPTCSPVGLPFIVAGAALYIAGGHLQFDWLSGIALVPLALGLLGILGGGPGFAWGWPAALFLAYMVPLPYQIETGLSLPLRSLATQGSTWLLQLLGLAAVPEGNVILLEHGRVSVAEACSGLSMFLTFFALATVVLIVARPPVLESVAVMVSVPAIAVASNVVRITATGLVANAWGPEVAHDWVHDQAGWFMMPVALALLFLELWMIGRACPVDTAEPKPLAGLLLPAPA
ncbi:exosortase/archaeosortase family protein [Limnoglobus roseus]|nr:exosortase/archaeosortase family protein [Limnoglobus roseus]